MPQPGPQLHGLTARALLIGLALVPVMAFWNEYTEIVAQATDLAAMSLPIAVVFALCVLIGLNLLLKRYLPRVAFTQAELLYIFVMQTVSIGISGIGMMQFLSTTLADYFYYATPENQWQLKFSPFLRSWLFPDPRVTRGFFTGQSSFYQWAVIRGWLSPILVWSALIFLLLGVMFCINVIIRKQWIERERLTFPIVVVPLEITQEGAPIGLLRNRTLWAGFAIPAAIETMASLNYLYPSVPFLPIKPSDPRLDITALFSTPPWNGAGTIQLSFYPLVIGLTYFLPLDVGFSLWFFFLFSRFENVAATALGYHQAGASLSASRMPYLGEQSAGAFIGLALFALYTMRTHLAEVLREALRPPLRSEVPSPKSAPRPHESDSPSPLLPFSPSVEPLSYRTAVLGVLSGSFALTAFSVALGMAWWIPLVFFVIYYLFVITFTRIRAEAGLPWGYGPDMNVHQAMLSSAGVNSMSTQSLVGFSQLLWFDLDYRDTAMPHQLEALKIADTARMNPRHVAYAVLLATAVGALASWIAILTCYYQNGAATAHVNDWRTNMGKETWNRLKDWMDNPTKSDLPRMEGVAIGVAVTAALMWLRSRFAWWPFHPVGYAVAGTFTMPWLWCATLMGWLVKVLTVRYGGMKTYRRAIPFFIGLILGDYVTGSLWAIYGSVTGVTTYRAFPI